MSKWKRADRGSPEVSDLRRKAEQQAHSRTAKPALAVSEADARVLLHELQVHQIELEMQNEELLCAHAAAEEASDKYGDLFDFAPVGYFLWDHHGRILEVNLAGATLLGLDRDAVIHKRFGQFVAMEDRTTFADFSHRVLATGTKQTCEVKIVKEGQAIDVLVEGIAAYDGQGQERLCRVAVIDISQQKRADQLAAANQALEAEIATRKRAEEALQQDRNLLRTLIDNLPDYIYVKDAQGRFVAANLATARMMGANAPNDLLGRTDHDFYPSELAKEYRTDEEDVLRSGQPLINKDEPHVDSSGNRRAVLSTKVPLKDSQGDVVGLVGIPD